MPPIRKLVNCEDQLGLNTEGTRYTFIRTPAKELQTFCQTVNTIQEENTETEHPLWSIDGGFYGLGKGHMCENPLLSKRAHRHVSHIHTRARARTHSRTHAGGCDRRIMGKSDLKALT